MFDFSGKVVLITGAAGALGSAVARAFGDAGASLALVDNREGRLATLFADVKTPAETHFINGINLTDEASVQKMADDALAHFGQIDALVNVAGGYRAGTPVHETPLDTWDFLLNLNARSVFLASRALIPHMLARGYGKIASVSAKVGLNGDKNAGAYSVSKSAILRLTESMAAELQGTGINVNCILPRIIDTPANRRAMPNADYGKWVTTQELANVLMFLCADVSSAVHGAAIPVYGAR